MKGVLGHVGEVGAGEGVIRTPTGGGLKVCWHESSLKCVCQSWCMRFDVRCATLLTTGRGLVWQCGSCYGKTIATWLFVSLFSPLLTSSRREHWMTFQLYLQEFISFVLYSTIARILAVLKFVQ